ncbi:RNA polymerase sigma factor (sigma-70 family) [Allocatelliglobosispora scoriae]|uniref:RNA polymerase sigma factor (Sigma-70 family) n=1 Tax=Allocatelliglobosispora scoriae TaxID=643052 RepID=A0A841BY60_9ACTN|nr:sigma-70 family RNA polymerase sigma factor [Allocatelliglobosispora scoriae]MBB5871863.1 RNA polymerase sigma factor (sigma-70 family) [Allocatelliglobosispora scoriae]
MTDEPLEDLLRRLTPQVLGALLRRYGGLDACEDAVQEALLAAATQWPEQGRPDNPHGWLVTVAARRLTDWIRSDSSRRRREGEVMIATPTAMLVAPPADEPGTAEHDDTLKLLFLCCHPALSAPSQIALTLRAVGGLTTAEIARAFLVPEATMAQRISRAKQTIRTAGATFALPPPDERAERLRAVLHVLYLMFNEGYTATAGPQLQRHDLTSESIRLTRLLHAVLPRESEVAGLLALSLLTDARRDARSLPDGSLVPLDRQDRSRWDRALITEGVDLISATLASTTELGPYQVQAAIAAIHDEAAEVSATDWPQILALYQLLEASAPNPMVTLNRIVAVAMVHGPQAGLDLLDDLAADERMARHHRLHAVRAHLLERAGQPGRARESYLTAARFATSTPEKRYLESRAAELG